MNALVTSLLYALLFIIAVLLLFWRFWFCRNPQRRTPTAQSAIVSPANGKVAVVQHYDALKKPTLRAKKWNHGSVEFLARDVAPKGWFVLLVMTPWNVHYQRAPVAGNVLETVHVKGGFKNAVKRPERLVTLTNEKNEILFTTKTPGVAREQRVKVVQIAGCLARRISCFVRKGDTVAKGESIGFINLGSQVALVLPENVQVTVVPGDAVVDGETIIAEWTTRRAKKKPNSSKKRKFKKRES